MPVVKVQVPIFTTDPNVPALVYDEKRRKLVQQQIDNEARARMGNDRKAFFEAEWTGRAWQLGERVGDQTW